MTRAHDAGTAVSAYLARHETKGLLRFITCGSVDDGKSTLIGRLLYESRALFADQLSALESDSRRHGTQGDDIDYALLLDGLSAEREQGITIDVAYRFFGTDKRKFIVADCPGHEQYTRNMATGASTADVAVVLVDARKGLLPQTRRHSYIVSLLGIRHVLLAVNKMDLVDYDQPTFDAIVAGYRELAAQLGIEHVQAVPLSALRGDNLLQRSDRTPWYDGPAVLDYLENVDVGRRGADVGFRLPVQWVNRPDQDFRGFAGTVAAGNIGVGDAIVALPSGRRSTIARIVTADGDLPQAREGQAVTLTLADELDISRGDVIADAHAPPQVSDQFAAHVLWMGEQALLPGRPYWLKIGTRTVSASVTEIKHKIDVNTQEPLAAKHLELNEVGFCNLYLDHGDAVRELRRQPRAGRLHPDRPAEQRHRRRRHAGVRAAPRGQHPLAAPGRRQDRACAHQGPAAARAVVHRPVGFGQVDHRQPRRQAPARAGLPHLHPRRRQRAPRPQQGPGLHRRGPRGEHPPRRRGGEADEPMRG